MSRVFLAQEIALERQVVIKVLPPEMAASLSVDRFNREIRLAAKLQHLHIVPLLSAGDVDGITGIDVVIVNGVMAVDAGKFTNSRAGKVLRR